MTFLFCLVAFITVGSAVSVVIARNPVYSAFWLVLHLLSVAGIFAMLEAEFLTAAQIIVYAGAIMVLVLFVIMLLGLSRDNEPFPILLGGGAIVAGAIFLAMFVPLLLEQYGETASLQGQFQGGVKEIGLVLYSKYLYPFEVASILIMAGIVGAVILARRKRDGSESGTSKGAGA